MKILIILLALAITGCANTQALTIAAREQIHAAAMAHARETLREAQEWKDLAQEASASQPVSTGIR